MKLSSLSIPEKWILKGVPILFFIGSILHFTYTLFGESIFVGLFSPVNESVWEHSKMILWPMILWWVLYYCFRGTNYKIDKNRWFSSALWALLTSLIAMPMLYYFYTSAFGVELLWVDIIILFLAILFGQLLGLHSYRHGKYISSHIVLAIFSILILMFILFTFCPPKVPWFQDGPTGNYGIAMHFA